ncbi:aldehyde dehydrogenase family protein [Mesorhizobium argentiipisi]|uniref:aldehyde dehydrogenase family protein n=1 Tax=Mesorhizobium argentiipisi TaxID=3015175 RepID=UPI0039F4F5C0
MRTRDMALAQKSGLALQAGLVGVNHMMVSTPETPFGGVNESGYGSEIVIEGLDAYLRTNSSRRPEAAASPNGRLLRLRCRPARAIPGKL